MKWMNAGTDRSHSSSWGVHSVTFLPTTYYISGANSERKVRKPLLLLPKLSLFAAPATAERRVGADSWKPGHRTRKPLWQLVPVFEVSDLHLRFGDPHHWFMTGNSRSFRLEEEDPSAVNVLKKFVSLEQTSAFGGFFFSGWELKKQQPCSV